MATRQPAQGEGEQAVVTSMRLIGGRFDGVAIVMSNKPFPAEITLDGEAYHLTISDSGKFFTHSETSTAEALSRFDRVMGSP